MKLKTITKEEMESMSYNDIAYIILKEKNKKIKFAELYDVICEYMEIDEIKKREYIAEFFTLLSTDKRFVSLSKGYWDLRENHIAKIEVEEDEEEDLDEISQEEDEDKILEEDEMYIDETKEIEDEEVEDEYQDLVLVDEENDIDL